MTRTVLDGRGRPRVLTPANSTIDGYRWDEKSPGWDWDAMDWTDAWADLDGPFGPHIKVANHNGETVHRVRGRGWRITGLMP